MKSLSVLDYSRNAIARLTDVKSGDRSDFINFYTNGEPDRVYVMMASFLDWKDVKIKSKDKTAALAGKAWTLEYRGIAAELYQENDDAIIKRDAYGFLLFDLDFLLAYFDEAKNRLANKLLGTT